MSDRGNQPPWCKDCGASISHQPEKALDGDVAVVWMTERGSWVCPVTGDEHVPGDPLSAQEAISYGIFAMNTLMDPSASSPEDVDKLEADADRAVYMLAVLRDYIDGQGDDFYEYGSFADGLGEEV